MGIRPTGHVSILGHPKAGAMSEGQHHALIVAKGLLATKAYEKQRRSFHSTETTNPCWRNLPHGGRTRSDACNPELRKSLPKTFGAKRFSERRDLPRTRHPQHRIVGRLGERVAAQFRQVNQALREDPVLLHPAERRNKIGSSPTLGRQTDGPRSTELFHALYGGITVDDADLFGLGVLVDGRDFSGELLQRSPSYGAGSIHHDHEFAYSAPFHGWQV